MNTWRTFQEHRLSPGSGHESLAVNHVIAQIDELGLTYACIEMLKPALRRALSYANENSHAKGSKPAVLLQVFIPSQTRRETERGHVKSWGFFIVRRDGDEHEQVIELFLYQEGDI